MTEHLFPAEAEHLVQCLRECTIEEVGSDKWLDLHEKTEQLNKNAHLQANDGTDEYIVDYLQVHDKVGVLIHNLITIETWKEFIYPHMKAQIAGMNCVRNYIPLYHEASLINLLEIAIFHEDACICADDKILDLFDYCYRKISYLIQKKNSELWPVHTDVKEAMEMTDLDILTQQFTETEFHIATSCISIIQSLTQHRSSCNITLTSRMIDTHDILLGLVPLMEKAPWIRKSKGGVLQKFEEHEWKVIEDDEHTKLPRLQGSLWLAIYNLVMDSEFCRRYEFVGNRKENLLRLRRFLHELVFDQIPPLADLLRSLENLSMQGHLQGQQDGVPMPVMVVQNSEIREGYLNFYKNNTTQEQWPSVASTAYEEIFSKEVSKEIMDRISNMVTMPEGVDDPVCGNCGGEALHRCSRCKHEWYCSRACQVAHWSGHEEKCNMMMEHAGAVFDEFEDCGKIASAASKQSMIQEVLD